MAKITAQAQASFSATLADEWARAGLRHAVIAPGSRSTPLVLALQAEERITLHVRLDERSAGFAALGIALASGRPAVVVTTSGTATAELHAAVVEAHQARVPLIVCTADRPPELQRVGAPQSIEQANLYPGATRFAWDLGVADEESSASWRSLAARAFCEATASPAGPGPVHLNLAFREPFGPASASLPPGRRGGSPWHTVSALPAEATLPAPLAAALSGSKRPVILAGARSGDPRRLLETAARLGWPVLADPRSGCRLSGSEAGGASVVAAADSIFRLPALRQALAPDLVVRLGEAWASKVVNSWLSETASEGAVHLLADPYGEWRDPGHEVTTVLRTTPHLLLGALFSCEAADPSWQAAWQLAEERAQGAIEDGLGRLGASGELTEPQIARSLAATPGVGMLFVSSSMPVRDLEWFSAPSPSYPRVLANRGANGIDGVISSTLGAAIGTEGGVVLGLLGDLAFLHDLTGLLQSSPRGTGPSGRPCGLVVVDNGGGGIFSYLPQASSVPAESFEALFSTPQRADVAELGRAAGLVVGEVSKPDELRDGLDELVGRVSQADGTEGVVAVLVCRVDRERGVAVHDELNEAVSDSLSS